MKSGVRIEFRHLGESEAVQDGDAPSVVVGLGRNLGRFQDVPGRMVTYGPVATVGEALESVEGVEEAYVYGSWAARYHGEPGSIPNDVDVLVVGDADEDELFEVARHCESLLGREVNVHRTSADRWHRSLEDPFLRTVRSRPLLQVVGDSQPEG